MELPIAIAAFSLLLYVASDTPLLAYTPAPLDQDEGEACPAGTTEWIEGYCTNGVCYSTREDCSAETMEDVVRT